jgi:hypothetical protein
LNSGPLVPQNGSALSRYSEEARRATLWLIALTVVLVGLTIALVVIAIFN